MKKLLTYSVVIATIVWSLGLAAVVPVATAAYTPAAGDLVKTANDSAVYYIDADGKRHLFVNEVTFWTWYSGTWSSIKFGNTTETVKTITQAEFDALGTGANVTARPGVNLVRFQNSPKAYAVLPGAKLAWVSDEATAKALYGDNWSKKVVLIQNGFENNYTKDGELTATSAVPDGSLIKYEGSSEIYYIDGGEKRLVGTEAFIANGFKDSAVLTVPTSMSFDNGSQITGEEAGLTGVASGSSVPVAKGALTVSMSSANPAATTIISDTVNTGQAMVPFLAVNLTASSEGDVVVNKMIFGRTGIGKDADITNSYLFDGTTLLAEGGSLSSKVLTFNDGSVDGIIRIPAGQTKTVVLKGDLAIAASAGQSYGFSLTEVVSNATSVSASYPIAGNQMGTASVTDMGYAVISQGTLPSGVASTSVNAGEKDFEVAKVALTATDQDLQLKGLRFTMIGSIAKDDLKNINLTIAGTTLATASIDADNYLYFDLSNTPYEIAKGNTKTFSVRADVVKGSTRTFKFGLDKASDVVVFDKGYGVYSQSFTSGAVTWTAIRPAGNFLISAGSLSVSKDTSSASGSIAGNATNVKIATYKFEAVGEDVKVNTLYLKATTTNTSSEGTLDGLQNAKIYFDGVQVGSTKNLPVVSTSSSASNKVPFSLGSSMIIPAGTTKLVDVYADIKSSAGVAISSGYVYVTLALADDNAQGQASLTLIDAPAADIASNTLTVTASSVSASKYAAYGNQTLTSPYTQAKLGSFTVTASANEGVDLSAIYVGNATSGELTDLKLMSDGVQLGSTKVTLPSTNTTSTFSVSNFSIAAGQSKVVDIYGNIKSGLTSASISLNASVEGTTKVTNTAVTSGAPQLQVITIGNASISNTSGSKPSSDIVIAGSTVKANAVVFTALNDGYTVKNLRVHATGTSAIAKVILEYPKKDGSTGTAEAVLNGSDADFSNLDMYVPMNLTAVLTIKAQTTSLASGATSGTAVQLGLADATGTTFMALADSGTTTYTGATASAGNPLYIRKTRPTISLETLPSTVLAEGTQTLSKFRVTADSAGDVSWRKISFAYTTSTGVSVTDNTIYIYNINDTSTALNQTPASMNVATKTITVTTTNEQLVGAGADGAQIYILQGDVTGIAGTDRLSITTKLNGTALASTSAGTSTNFSDLNTYETGFIWSDMSGTPHYSNGTSRDWSGANYVKTLPSNTQTLSIN